MEHTAARMADIRPSPTIALANRAKVLRRSGADIIELGTGDPDFPTPRHIAEAAVQALRDGHTHYELSRGALEVREAISAKLQAENNVRADPGTEILVTPGAKQGILYVLLATLGGGDEVLIPEPSWVSYPDMVHLAGATPVMVPTSRDSRFRLDPDELARKITPRSRMILLASPNNPTGVLFSEKELLAVAALAEQHDLLVVSDEVYEKILFVERPLVSFGSLPGMAGRAVTINGFSKTYAMTGWRLGYMAAPSWLIDRALTIQQQSATCVCSFAQYGGLAALQGPQDEVRRMVDVYRRRRDRVLAELGRSNVLRGVAPEGTFYVFIDVRATERDSERFAEEALEKALVTTVPGDAFGVSGEGFVRMSFALPDEQLLEGLRRLLCYFGETGVGRA